MIVKAAVATRMFARSDSLRNRFKFANVSEGSQAAVVDVNFRNARSVCPTLWSFMSLLTLEILTSRLLKTSSGLPFFVYFFA